MTKFVSSEFHGLISKAVTGKIFISNTHVFDVHDSPWKPIMICQLFYNIPP